MHLNGNLKMMTKMRKRNQNPKPKPHNLHPKSLPEEKKDLTVKEETRKSDLIEIEVKEATRKEEKRY